MFHPSRLSLPGKSNNVWWSIQTIKPCTMQFYAPPCYFQTFSSAPAGSLVPLRHFFTFRDSQALVQLTRLARTPFRASVTACLIQTADCNNDESWFNFLQGNEIFHFSSPSKPVVRITSLLSSGYRNTFPRL
jgi:hypothetical protein